MEQIMETKHVEGGDVVLLVEVASLVASVGRKILQNM